MARKNLPPTTVSEQFGEARDPDSEDESSITPDEKADLGRKIRRVRDSFGWTLDQLSETTKQVDPAGSGVSKVSISRYENGDAYPGYRELKLIALGLGTPITYFFYGDKPDPYGDWNVSLDEYLRTIVRDELIEAGVIEGKSMRQKQAEKMSALQEIAGRRQPLSSSTRDVSPSFEVLDELVEEEREEGAKKLKTKK